MLNGTPYQERALDAATSSTFGANSALRAINDLHESPDNVRFAMLKSLTPKQEFNLLTNGASEAYTSTYNGVLNDMLGQLKQNNLSLMDAITPREQDKMATFLASASSYGRLQDVLHYIPKENLPKVVHGMVENVMKEGDLASAAAVAELMTNMKGDNPIRALLENEVKNHYLNPSAADPQQATKEKDMFGLLASAYGSNGEAITPQNKAFFMGIAQNDRYQLASMESIGKDKLVDGKGISNQLMIFADDADSKASFANWEKTYQGRSGWKIEEHASYVEIHSTGGKVPVHLFANKPDHHDDGLADIKKDVAKRQDSDTPQFQSFTGRGHSYHAGEYIKEITPDMKLISLGSCGGYNNMNLVLAKSPESQITATQGRGTMYVNDPMLMHINESLNKNGKIDWNQEQKFLDQLHSTDKEKYLLPNKDVPLMLIKKYNDLQNGDNESGKTKSLQTQDFAALDFTALKSAATPTAPSDASRHSGIT